jgi:cell division protein FtsI/penicillin-binding protein 2/serine/threonine protein phosphatase PrpC
MFTWHLPKAFRSFAYSTTGRREGNEDNYLIIQTENEKIQARYLYNQQPQIQELKHWPTEKLRIAVADGMGGHSNGREASESLIKQLLAIPPVTKASQLAAHLKTIHKKLLESSDGVGRTRPGSTLVVADIDDQTGLCIIASVGDSRAYLLRAGRLHQLSHDHIYPEFAWRDGDIKDEEYFTARLTCNNHLSQAMGFGSHGIIRDADGSRPYQYNPNLRLDFKDDGQLWQEDWNKSKQQHRDVFLLQLLPDDILLLGSDGLWSTGFDNSWQPNLTTPLTNTAALEKLAHSALAAGSQDNITVVMSARAGAVGGYNAIDGKTEQVYQDSKNILHAFSQKYFKPLQSKLTKANAQKLKPSILLALLAFFWLVIAARIVYLQGQTAIVTVQSSGLSEDQQLFERLKNSSLLEADTQKRLLLKPADYDLAQQSNGTPLAEADKKLLTDLYNSIAGQVVRKQVDIWNQTREFSAVRDSSEIKWMITDKNGLKPASSDTVPEAFGFVHQKQLGLYSYGALRTEFNSWQVSQHSDAVSYQREISAGDGLRSQYVGHLQECELIIAGQNAKDCKSLIQPLCKIGSSLTKSSCNAADASAGEITLPRQLAQATLTLKLEAVANPIDKVNGLAIYYQCQEKPCAINKQNFAYRAEKTLEIAHQEVKDSKFTIQTADGELLTDELGVLSAKAEELGLTGLIGVDKNDVGRLSYLMAKSHFDENYALNLTIDSKIQQAAHQTLSDWFKQNSTDLYHAVRRGALVVLDTETGDILASASFPQPPKGVDWNKKAWDKSVFASRYYQLDPFLNRAWQGGDANQAPGSTFKVLMALAAAQRIQELKPDPNTESPSATDSAEPLESYFTGLNQARFTRLTGLKMSDYQLPIFNAEYLRKGTTQFEISNFRMSGGSYETMADFYNKPLGVVSCGTSPMVKNRLGVTEALRDSSNVWFAELAKLIDGEAAEYHDLYNQSGELDLYLKRFMKKFGFAENTSLIAGVDDLNNKQQALWRNAALLNTPARFKENTPPLLVSKTDALMNLTQTAIGQSLFVTPLEMAQIATLAATGNWLKPNLISQWADNPITVLEHLQLDEASKSLIHTGLAAVVQTGTAKDAFAHHPDRCRVYGKTGTAQVGTGGRALAPYNTAWFIGWREPKVVVAAEEKSEKHPKEKKLAFACMVTHASKSETGGSVCAPLVANFLTTLNGITAHKQIDK